MARRPHPSDATDEGFLSRWSRRKLEGGEEEVQAEQPPPAEEPPPSGAAETPAAGSEAAVEVPQKTDADMPPIESINDESRVSDFFSPGVSEALRKAALRKLFHLPKYNIVDGLNDYDDDFRSFAALGDVVTADMRQREQLEADQAREAREPAEKTTAEGGAAEGESRESTTAGETAQATAEEAVTGEQDDDGEPAEGLAAAPSEENGDEQT